MPKTIAIAARKGGPGKTTLAVNLAAAAANSTIVDIDPQNSAGIWGDGASRALLRIAVRESRPSSQPLLLASLLFCRGFKPPGSSSIRLPTRMQTL